MAKALKTSLIFIVAYWLFWNLTRFSSASFVMGIFYPTPALTFGIIAIFGWRYAPVIWVGIFLAVIPSMQWTQPPEFYVLQTLRQIVVYGAAGHLARLYLDRKPGSSSTEQVVAFSVLAIFASLASTLAAGVILPKYGQIDANDILGFLASFWLGDFTGLLICGPLVLWSLRHYKDGRLKSEFGRLLRTGEQNLTVFLLPIFGGIAIILAPTLSSEFLHLTQLAYIPLAWVAATKGLKAGLLATLITDMTAFSVNAALGGVGFDATQFQFFFAGGTLIVMIVGAAYDDREASRALSRQRETELHHVSRVATIGELNVAIAHELNQPLSVIGIHTHLLEHLLSSQTIDPEKIGESLKAINASIKRADDVQKKIRGFARREAGETTPANINDVIEQALEFIEPEARMNGISVSRSFADALPKVQIDSTSFQQVILNLVMNAIEAITESKSPTRKVEARTVIDAEQNKVRIELADSGPGIPAENLKSIFESFFTTKANGLGMGLAICRTIIESLGGNITVTSSPGEGTCFAIELPVAGHA